MPEPTKLTDKQIENALRALPDWSLAGGELHRDFTFADFSEAFAFMTRIAAAAQQRNHHPKWSDL